MLISAWSTSLGLFLSERGQFVCSEIGVLWKSRNGEMVGRFINAFLTIGVTKVPLLLADIPRVASAGLKSDHIPRASLCSRLKGRWKYFCGFSSLFLLFLCSFSRGKMLFFFSVSASWQSLIWVYSHGVPQCDNHLISVDPLKTRTGESSCPFYLFKMAGALFISLVIRKLDMKRRIIACISTFLSLLFCMSKYLICVEVHESLVLDCANN